jgi:hypothetical protein
MTGGGGGALSIYLCLNEELSVNQFYVFLMSHTAASRAHGMNFLQLLTYTSHREAYSICNQHFCTTGIRTFVMYGSHG